MIIIQLWNHPVTSFEIILSIWTSFNCCFRNCCHFDDIILQYCLSNVCPTKILKTKWLTVFHIAVPMINIIQYLLFKFSCIWRHHSVTDFETTVHLTKVSKSGFSNYFPCDNIIQQVFSNCADDGHTENIASSLWKYNDVKSDHALSPVHWGWNKLDDVLWDINKCNLSKIVLFFFF